MAVDRSLLGVVGSAKVIQDDEDQGDETEGEDVVGAASAAAGVETDVVVVLARGEA